jgi:2-methylcitrate dehydratase PrpD
MVMMGEPTGPEWVRKDLLKNPKIRKFQHKVKLVEDPIATKKFYPEYKTPSTVEIIMKNA